MQSFLSRLASKAIEEHPDSLGDLTIVLPSRRAIVFLRNEFKKQLTIASWLPQLISIEDFAQELGKYQQVDQLDLLFQLYEVYQKIEGQSAEPFSDFMNWAPTLIQDFNEIDRYLVDARELYGFITEAKAIENWNLDGEELTAFQKRYLNFWQSLHLYYDEFRKHLLAQNVVYQGLGFRTVAETIENRAKDEFGSLCFAGFNALTAAEEKIIDYFVEEKGAEVVWDADRYYLEDQTQEAGYFLRKHQKRSKKEFNWISDNLLQGQKNIEVYEVAGNTAQAKLVGNLLKQGDKENTAVVLSDESLLLPVLESLDEDVSAVNVTMGYPVLYSSMYNLIEAYLLLFKRSAKWKNEDLKEATRRDTFFFQELYNFLESISLQLLEDDKRVLLREFIRSAKERKTHFFRLDELRLIEEGIGIPLFDLPTNYGKQIIENGIKLIELVQREGENTISLVERECMYALYQSLNRLKDIVGNGPKSMDVSTLYQLFRQIISKESVDFIGEPLSGIQLMGVLESRVLDFEEVIITSVNEGVLPSGKTQNSFIPFDIKRKYGLPVYKEKDAIFSYHFYRLIQRAKKISILVNSKVHQLQGGEMSRFVKQLIFEATNKNKHITLKQNSLFPKIVQNQLNETVVPNNSNILQAIRNHFNTGLSPSAVNTFLSCPLNYYYKYVLGMKEQQTLEEKVESSTLGTIIHNSLEELYQPYLHVILHQKDLVAMTNKIEAVLIKQFVAELNVQPTNGNYRLNFEIAKVFVKNVIGLDQQLLEQGNEVRIIELEKEVESSFEVKHQSETISVKIKGKIDRIDKFNGQLRIIDYKSGGVNPTDLSFSKLEALLSGKKEKAVQMLLYQLCYQNMERTEDLSAGIISLKNISRGFIPLQVDDVMDQGIGFLEGLTSKMINQEHFAHNTDSKFCPFC